VPALACYDLDSRRKFAVLALQFVDAGLALLAIDIDIDEMRVPPVAMPMFCFCSGQPCRQALIVAKSIVASRKLRFVTGRLVARLARKDRQATLRRPALTWRGAAVSWRIPRSRGAPRHSAGVGAQAPSPASSRCVGTDPERLLWLRWLRGPATAYTVQA
jgi:hypothetical protein